MVHLPETICFTKLWEVSMTVAQKVVVALGILAGLGLIASGDWLS